MYESIDVPPAQVFVLLTVSEKTTCNLSDIGQELNITAPTASGLVARLVKKGYLKRGQNAADRRKLDISLTNSGRKVIGKFQQNVLKMWRKNLKKFSPIERMGPLYFIKQILKDIEP
jgi:DNA-binding MarR family transcriptional regulator